MGAWVVAVLHKGSHSNSPCTEALVHAGLQAVKDLLRISDEQRRFVMRVLASQESMEMSADPTSTFLEATSSSQFGSAPAAKPGPASALSIQADASEQQLQASGTRCVHSRQAGPLCTCSLTGTPVFRPAIAPHSGAEVTLNEKLLKHACWLLSSVAVMLCSRPSGSEAPVAKAQMPSWMTDSPGGAIEFADMTSPTVTAAKVDVFPQTSAGYISKVTCQHQHRFLRNMPLD